MITLTQCKMRMLFCQTVFKADPMIFKLLDRFYPCYYYLGLML